MRLIFGEKSPLTFFAKSSPKEKTLSIEFLIWVNSWVDGKKNLVAIVGVITQALLQHHNDYLWRYEMRCRLMGTISLCCTVSQVFEESSNFTHTSLYKLVCILLIVIFYVVQSLSHVQLFVTPWTAACQVSWSPSFPEFAETHVHWFGDAIQPSHALSSSAPPFFNLSQHQDLFQWVSSSHQVTKVLELQLQYR